MKSFIPKGLTQRFFILGFCFIFIPLFIIFFVAVSSSQEKLEKQTERQTLQVATTLANKTNNLFQMKMKLLKTIAINYIPDSDKIMEEGSPHFMERIDEIAVNDPFFSHISIVNKQGEIMYESPLQTANQTLTVDMIAMFEELKWRRAPLFSTTIQERETKPALRIAIPFQTEDHGEIQGAILAQVSLSYLQKYYKKDIVEVQGRSFILDANGDVILDTDNFHTIGTSFQSLPFYELALLDRTGIYQGSLLEVESLVAYRPINGYPFISVAAQPLQQAHAPITTLSTVLIRGLIIISITALILLFFSARFIVRPIKNLTEEAGAYARGGDWQILILKEKDEIETLSKTMKYMAEGLKEKERYLQLILASFPFGVITMEPDGTITSTNKVGEKLLGISKLLLIGKPISVLPFPILKSHLEKCNKSSQPFENFENEFTFINPKGSKVTMKISSSPLLDEKEDIIGVLTIIWDVTKVRQLEEHLQRSEQLGAIGQMTAGLAHEIKNPLGTVQMASDLIDVEFNELVKKYSIRDPSASMVHEAVNDIQEEMKRLNHLVKSFLQLSRKHKEEERELNLKQTLEEILQLLSHQFRHKDIEVDINLPDHSFPVSGDHNQLIQAFLNLLLNAIESVEQQGKIKVSLQTVEDKHKVSISDNGTGMSPSRVKRIFTPFFSTKQEGTGLGLSITHDIIVQHKGHIEVESEEGKRTTMVVYLPNHAYIGDEGK